MSVNKPVNCSQRVITDFFTSETPRESDKVAHIPEVDCDLVYFRHSVELKFESIPDLDNVINLSDHMLTIPQREILNKGLKFCPTPGEAQMGDLRRDLDKYHRSLRLKSHFKDDIAKATDGTSIGPFNDTSCLKLQSVSKYNPPVGSNNLETVITMNEIGLQDSIPTRPTKKNIETAQLNALRELSANNNIVIKPADKGGATVILNRADYVAEGLRQLSDQNFYLPIDDDLTTTHNEKIATHLENMIKRGEITERVARFLVTKEPRTAQLYLLPKIHKNVTPVPGRPIVSANESPTERVSAFVDNFLAPIVRTGRSYIRDTSDFLLKLQDIRDLRGDEILLTLDVSSLYTNIPNEEGTMAALRALRQARPGDTQPSNLSLVEMLAQVLSYNNFQFDGKNYLQVGGTAMGTRVAPSYANIFMNDFEDKHVYTHHLQPLAWYRYIDDVFCLWQHGEEELEKFNTHLNSVHETIKFTVEKSRTSVSFLDTEVHLDNSTIYTTLYVKPTDRNNYLPFDSAHPYHCKKGLPYGQFLRIRRICSKEDDYRHHCVEKAALLRQKGYPQMLIDEAYVKARDKGRNELLKPADRSVSHLPPKTYMTTTYNPSFDGLRTQVKKTWDLLDRSSSTRHIHTMGLQVGYRRPKNLRDLLVRSKLSPILEDREPTEGQDKKCTNRKCRYCPLLNTEGHIVATVTNRKHRTKHNVTCKSNNLVYCITCRRCKKQYVGQTKNSLKQRFQGHFYQVVHDVEKTEVSRHFNRNGHQGLTDVEIHVLDFIHLSTTKTITTDIRLGREFDWIHRLHCIIPKGLNSLDGTY